MQRVKSTLSRKPNNTAGQVRGGHRCLHSVAGRVHSTAAGSVGCLPGGDGSSEPAGDDQTHQSGRSPALSLQGRFKAGLQIAKRPLAPGARRKAVRFPFLSLIVNRDLGSRRNTWFPLGMANEFHSKLQRNKTSLEWLGKEVREGELFQFR